MLIKNLDNILSIFLCGTISLNCPVRDSYTISMPLHIDLNQQGSFNVGLVDCQINDSDKIEINFEEQFELNDEHGKNNIYGTIYNPSIIFNNDDSSPKTINYTIDGISAGQWSGNLNVKISLEQKQESNILIDGKSINKILRDLNPSIINFSHQDIDGEYLYDLSTAKDESILLYKINDEVIITNGINSPIKANENMSAAFYNLNVTEINNLEYLDMSTCIDASQMFQRCEKIQSIDVSSFNTTNITNMSHMFDSMHALKNIIGLENFDVTNAENLSYLINDDRALESIPNLGLWNVSNKCNNISYIFNCVGYTANKYGASKWPNEFDLSNWDVSNVTNMSHSFANSFGLVTLNLSGWNTQNVTNMSSMFEMTDPTEKSNLQTIIGIEDFNVSGVNDMSYMFHECRNFSGDLSNWTPNSVNNLKHAFYDTRKLSLFQFEDWNQYIDFENVDISECFGSYAGYYSDKTYRPSWYN